MKKVVFAVVLLLLIPVCIFAGQFYLKNATSGMRQTLLTAERDLRAKNEKAAKKQVKKFTAQWKKNRPYLATFIRHSELDPVTLGVPKLTAYLEGGEDADFFAQSGELRTQLRHLYDMERISPDNFF